MMMSDATPRLSRRCEGLIPAFKITIAHHHGSGRLRRDYLHHDLGANGLALLRKLKQAIDPQGILNPGNLLPLTDAD